MIFFIAITAFTAGLAVMNDLWHRKIREKADTGFLLESRGRTYSIMEDERL